MKANIIDVCTWAEDRTVREDLKRATAVREEALRRAYELPGYEELTAADKRGYYDQVKADVLRGMHHDLVKGIDSLAYDLDPYEYASCYEDRTDGQMKISEDLHTPVIRECVKQWLRGVGNETPEATERAISLLDDIHFLFDFMECS